MILRRLVLHQSLSQTHPISIVHGIKKFLYLKIHGIQHYPWSISLFCHMHRVENKTSKVFRSRTLLKIPTQRTFFQIQFIKKSFEKIKIYRIFGRKKRVVSLTKFASANSYKTAQCIWFSSKQAKIYACIIFSINPCIITIIIVRIIIIMRRRNIRKFLLKIQKLFWSVRRLLLR